MILDENYRLESDSNNWILKFEEVRVKEKDNSEYLFEESIGYYPRISQALRKYLDCCLKECDTAKEIMVEIERVEKLILKMDVK